MLKADYIVMLCKPLYSTATKTLYSYCWTKERILILKADSTAILCKLLHITATKILYSHY
jgi:hypothetical protein